MLAFTTLCNLSASHHVKIHVIWIVLENYVLDGPICQLRIREDWISLHTNILYPKRHIIFIGGLKSDGMYKVIYCLKNVGDVWLRGVWMKQWVWFLTYVFG